MDYTLEVTVRIIGPDGVPADRRGRPCDEEKDQIQATLQLSTHKGLEAALLAFEDVLTFIKV